MANTGNTVGGVVAVGRVIAAVEGIRIVRVAERRKEKKVAMRKISDFRRESSWLLLVTERLLHNISLYT